MLMTLFAPVQDEGDATSAKSHDSSAFTHPDDPLTPSDTESYPTSQVLEEAQPL